MESSRFARWLRQVYETQEQELPCSELFDQIAHYVDREIAGEAVAQTMPDVKHTLDVCRDQCRACYEVYEALHNLARLEAEGRTPSIDDLRRSL